MYLFPSTQFSFDRQILLNSTPGDHQRRGEGVHQAGRPPAEVRLGAGAEPGQAEQEEHGQVRGRLGGVRGRAGRHERLDRRLPGEGRAGGEAERRQEHRGRGQEEGPPQGLDSIG